jgi:pimeloyl-ACP methyl ester carboxylesterase
VTAVLLVHSGGFSSRQWRNLAEVLAKTYRVILPDLLGYGAAGAWPSGTPFHFSQDVALLESLLDEPAHLVGHSYGGFLALKVALARPDAVRSLALYEPVAFGILDEPKDAELRAVLGRVKPRYEPDASGVDEAWLAEFVEFWNGAGAWSALPEDTRRGFRAVGWKVYQEVATLLADTTDRATYARVTAPTLLLGGDRSPLPERRVVEKLAAALPHTKLQIFAGVGHMGPITHASQVNAAILAHLSGA